MELPQSNTIIPAWKSKILLPYEQDQLKSQVPKNYGIQRNFKQAQPFYSLPSVNNYYKVNYNLERLYNQPVAK